MRMQDEIKRGLLVAALVAAEDWCGSTIPDAMALSVDWVWSVVLERVGDLRPYLDELQLSLSSGVLAGRMNLEGPKTLNALLWSRGLPSYDRLRDLYYVVAITERFSDTQTISKFALSRCARSAGYYRLFERTMCITWTAVKCNGSTWAKAFALNQWAIWIRAQPR